ncbi:MAG: helix-turn-helix transcriptional regulator [Clostridiaceae bacterium]|nr:helix-turn-helix transcriptional regulator [Clostridiaceae bacterium]
MNLAKRLKDVRTSRKLTKKAVAEKLKIAQSTYGKYELGEREPNFEKLVNIANYFNVSTDFLLGLSDTKALNSDNSHLDKEALEAVATPEITALTEEVLAHTFETISNEVAKSHEGEHEYQEASERYNQLRAEIEALLPPDKKDLLESLYEAEREMECIVDKQVFITTLKFGVNMAKMLTNI